jgi:hypothetical protein
LNKPQGRHFERPGKAALDESSIGERRTPTEDDFDVAEKWPRDDNDGSILPRLGSRFVNRGFNDNPPRPPVIALRLVLQLERVPCLPQ